ncbi:MAG: sulfite exporter TauE/SafE family protein [Epsilonproteobacteria bacterium]|nr:sulfite exporter TauE/SafE family protein [Campylobacterota bacterium]NPA56394.1 sulfite exporter TauE/SafE family protein [Campylobacterota bacterium]
MELLLALVGIGVGFLSGFFGIGGGTILVPILLYLGFGIKEAVGISVTQMVFSSLYGSFLNLRKAVFQMGEGIAIGMGGAVGALLSGYFLKVVPEKVLEYIFLAIVLFAFIRFFTKRVDDGMEEREPSPPLLFVLGLFVGLIAISVGVGGSILITPVLVGIFHLNVKKAAAMGLFFVIFSSLSGFLSLSLFGHIDYLHGFIVGASSLIGVHFGIRLAHRVGKGSFKRALVAMYGVILLMTIRKIFF